MLTDPLNAEELEMLAQAGQTTVPGLINPRSAVFKKMGVNRDELDQAAGIELVQSNPRILIRPIVQAPGFFLTGFSEASYQNLL